MKGERGTRGQHLGQGEKVVRTGRDYKGKRENNNKTEDD